MTESPSILPAFDEKDRCECPADLLLSAKFAAFLDLYNRKNKTQVTVPDIINNYKLACDVWDFARNCKLAGGSPMRVSADICSLVNDILAEVKVREKKHHK